MGGGSPWGYPLLHPQHCPVISYGMRSKRNRWSQDVERSKPSPLCISPLVLAWHRPPRQLHCLSNTWPAFTTRIRKRYCCLSVGPPLCSRCMPRQDLCALGPLHGVFSLHLKEVARGWVCLCRLARPGRCWCWRNQTCAGLAPGLGCSGWLNQLSAPTPSSSTPRPIPTLNNPENFYHLYAQTLLDEACSAPSLAPSTTSKFNFLTDNTFSLEVSTLRIQYALYAPTLWIQNSSL